VSHALRTDWSSGAAAKLTVPGHFCGLHTLHGWNLMSFEQREFAGEVWKASCFVMSSIARVVVRAGSAWSGRSYLAVWRNWC
jgi:hypothetical protein